ncbi:MAG: T9SS type A sorting domain-containing protein [Bacteroidetes bacterium]|nr:T9SS type A sorting domain-containing protein [Bacteroidota bacterium]
MDDICLSTDSAFTFNYQVNCLNTGVFENGLISENNEFYPNPASNKINITNINKSIFSLKIYNLDGCIVLEKKDIVTEEVDISSLSNGLYFIEISTYNFNKKEKLIIQK